MEHILDLCASITSDKDIEDLTGEEIKQAFVKRVNSIQDDEWVEAVGFVESSDD